MLRAVARNFAIHRVAPGERVVHEGESLDTLYFIGTGSFEVTQKGKVVGLLGKIKLVILTECYIKCRLILSTTAHYRKDLN